MKGWPIRGDWHDWRPAIWLTMIGIAVMLLFSPFFLGALFIGAAIGVAIRIRQRRRRLAAVLPVLPRRLGHRLRYRRGDPQQSAAAAPGGRGSSPRISRQGFPR